MDNENRRQHRSRREVSSSAVVEARFPEDLSRARVDVRVSRTSAEYGGIYLILERMESRC